MSISRKECRFEMSTMPEDIPLDGNVLVSGDDEEDKRAEQLVLKQLESGNDWAWCTVKITCIHIESGITGHDYLGCCSYASEDDFIKGGYLDDMQAQAFDECSTECSRIRKALD